MSREIKMPILCQGEQLISPVKKKIGGAEKEAPRTYEEAKEHILTNLSGINSDLEKEYYFDDEVIFCLRMADGYTAKSYFPNSLIATAEMSSVGGRNYQSASES